MAPGLFQELTWIDSSQPSALSSQGVRERDHFTIRSWFALKAESRKLKAINTSERQDQNVNFSPNCISRPVVTVLVMMPALLCGAPVLVNRLAPGRPKLARLNRLNTSARNCRARAPDTGKFLYSDRSNVASPGPMTV